MHVSKISEKLTTKEKIWTSDGRTRNNGWIKQKTKKPSASEYKERKIRLILIGERELEQKIIKKKKAFTSWSSSQSVA